MLEIEIILMAGMIIAALLAIISKDMLLSVIYLALMSLLMSMEFYILQAPDVAIAEAGVGAGIFTAIYILALKKSERWDND